MQKAKKHQAILKKMISQQGNCCSTALEKKSMNQVQPKVNNILTSTLTPSKREL